MICDYCKHKEEKGCINACLSCKWDDSLVDNFEPKTEIKPNRGTVDGKSEMLC